MLRNRHLSKKTLGFMIVPEDENLILVPLQGTSCLINTDRCTDGLTNWTTEGSKSHVICLSTQMSLFQYMFYLVLLPGKVEHLVKWILDLQLGPVNPGFFRPGTNHDTGTIGR